LVPLGGAPEELRSIRRGIAQVVSEIEQGTFGVTYRNSSLETVVHSIAEQRQIFQGADHAFLWKPKLRIPDIYEDAANQEHLVNSPTAPVATPLMRSSTTSTQSWQEDQGPAVANAFIFCTQRSSRRSIQQS
jgi:type II restriction enzyme